MFFQDANQQNLVLPDSYDRTTPRFQARNLKFPYYKIKEWHLYNIKVEKNCPTKEIRLQISKNVKHTNILSESCVKGQNFIQFQQALRNLQKVLNHYFTTDHKHSLPHFLLGITVGACLKNSKHKLTVTKPVMVRNHLKRVITNYNLNHLSP